MTHSGSTTEKRFRKGVSEEDGRKGIFIRLGPHAKRTLDGAAADRTYAEVIEKLIEYYGEQDDKIKEEILSGKLITLTKFEDLMALTQRAQHAFENKRYYFAAITYMAIDGKLTDSYSSKALKDLCNYRRAHCWMKLSYELRLEGLKTKNMDSYAAARDALQQALMWLGDLRDNGDPFIDLVKHYNMACCYSLQAQYEVESRVGSETRDFNELLEAAEKDLPETTSHIWVGIGDNWRTNKNVDSAARERVDDYAAKAYDELEMIYPSSTAFESPNTAQRETKASDSKLDFSLLYELIWIVETAKKDSDLVFLRSDKELWQDRFKRWVANAPKSQKPPLAAAIEDLRRRENLARREGLRKNVEQA